MCNVQNVVGRLLQNSTMYICIQQSILIQLQHRIFSFHDYIYSSSTQDIFIQRLHSFNFNTGYCLCKKNIYLTSKPKVTFYGTNIFIQLQQKHFHSTQHIYSTLRKFPDIDKFSFNKAPSPYPLALLKMKQ